jgi:AcrR family transcriptional regulator
MTAQFLIDMDESIVSKARTPKGMRTLQAILDATYVLISTEGVAAASQEAIAKRANLTQSAVRYYFPKKEHLLYAFFYANIKRLEAQFEEELAKTDRDARSQLMRIVTLHCERILAVEDVFYFEAANYWARNTGYRQLRNDWYKTAVSYGRCNI